MIVKLRDLDFLLEKLLRESQTRFEHGYSIVYIMPTFDDLIELIKSRPDTLRFVISDEIYGVASGYGSTHTNIHRALRNFTNAPSGDLILVTDASSPFEESEWSMFFDKECENDWLSFAEGYDDLPIFVQRDLDDMRAIWNDHFANSIARKKSKRGELP